MNDRETLRAERILDEACRKHGIDLAVLVAESSLWANPGVHRHLAATPEGPVWYPNRRRYRVGAGERKGQVKDGVQLDDNTYANYAIKRALGFAQDGLVGFEVCHIWPLTAYEAQYHTCIANLVLLPRSLAGLSDHDQRIAAVLQYRSLELYGWCPDPERPPQRPDAYPTNWRAPFSMPGRLPR
jgi:hypothetical protein